MKWVGAREAKVLEAVSTAAVFFLDECIRALLHFQHTLLLGALVLCSTRH